MDDSVEIQNIEEKIIFGARVVNPSDPDVFDNADSARVRARQIGCIGIRRYNNRNGTASWMPCTNESDFRRVSGIGHSGRRFRRQEIEKEVRRVIGGRSGKKIQSKSANYTKPQLRETIKKRIMAGSKGGAPGQWSARKAQLVALAYRKAGGGYKGGKTGKQRSLSKWTKQKWRTSDGKRARRGGVTRRYLPASAWSRLTVGQRAATNRKKIQGSRRGEQFVSNTAAAKRARKRSSQGQKHIEFYEDYEVKALGGKKIGSGLPGRLGTGSGGARKARKIRGSIRGSLEGFNPNAYNADPLDDNTVQDGTRFERPAPPRKPVGVTPEVGGFVREPQINIDKPFSRAARMADGRYSVTAPEIATRVRPAARKIKKGATKKPRFITKTPTKRRKLEQSQFDSVPVGRASNLPKKLQTFEYEQDTLQSLRFNRSKIYNQYVNGESTISELADKFDVVRDEIKQEINLHRKFRSKNTNSFSKQNPRLISKIKKFTNSRTSYEESISEGKFKNWDGLVQYVFRSPDIKNTRQNMLADLFKFFPSGENPDRPSNIVLGYVPSANINNKIPVKIFSDKRKPRTNFRQTNEVLRKPAGTGSASSFAERPTRTYRRDNLRAEALISNLSLTGKMASPMTPSEEVAWKKREWKRQQLKNFAVELDASKKYPSLKNFLRNQDIASGIQALDALNDQDVDDSWDKVVADIAKIPGAATPAYQTKQAPLSPRELAAIAPKRRPLVKVFVDEYKKINSTGIISNLDVDNMDDSEIESFYNTFILPELVNTGSPTAQEVQQTIGIPSMQDKLTDAERLLASQFTNFNTLQYRLKVGRKVLAEQGMDPNSPEFDAALEKFLGESEQKDFDNFNNQLQEWLNPGSPMKREPKLAINPETDEPYTQSELEKLINEVGDALETLNNQVNPELMEARAKISAVQQVLETLKSNEDFLNDPSKLPDPSVLPINVVTGKPYTLREWVESGSYKLLRMAFNPSTDKIFTKEELEKIDINMMGQIDQINDKIGRPLISEINELQSFQQRLLKAWNDASFDDDDDDIDTFDSGTDVLDEERDAPEPPTIEEIQTEYQDIIDNSREILETEVNAPVEITKDSLKRIKKLLKSTSMEIEPRSSAPDSDEFWNEIGPGYAGDPNDPLNKPTSDGKPVALNSPDFLMQAELLDQYLSSAYAQEWSDIQNTHTVARYTDVPEEIAKYAGEFADGADPAKIDKRIQWDRMLDVFFQTNPELFRKGKNGEIIGETLDRLAQQLGMDRYGGASYSPFAGQTADTSGYQLKAQLEELAEAKRLSQAEQFLSSTKKSAAERTKLWNLFSVQTLTPEEIAFQEGIVNIDIVTRALNQYEIDNNISSAARNNLDGVSKTAFKTRASTFQKSQTKQLIEGIRELAQLSAPSSSPRATAKDLIATAERAKIFLQTTIDKIGKEYDQFRRTKQMIHNMVSSLLKTRPGNFSVDAQNPNRRNKFGQTGWDITKEPLLRYLNRIKRWDEENIGFTDARTGEYRRGLVKILTDFDRSLDLQTGDPAGSSATTAISQNAKFQIAQIDSFISDIKKLKTSADAQGLTGFMRAGGFVSRATDSTKNAAQKAATGRANFADPNILKRYDRAGFNVTKKMLGQASGFNKKFTEHISESIKNNTSRISDAPGFTYLNPAEKDFMLLTEHIGNTPRLFDGPDTSRRNRTNVGRLNQSTESFTIRRVSPFKNRFRGKEYKSGVTGRMASGAKEFLGETRKNRQKFLRSSGRIGSYGFQAVASESFGKINGVGQYYIVDQNGQILSEEIFNTRAEAEYGAERLRIVYAKQRTLSALPVDIASFEATKLGIRQSGYKSTSLIRRNAAEVAPIDATGKQNSYIISKDRLPQQRSGDVLIIRKNPQTYKTEALVITRKFAPHKGDNEKTVSLPGGMFDPEEDKTIYDAAEREAVEEVGLSKESILFKTDLGTTIALDWDPRFAKGMEATGLLIKVSPDWTPKAATDAIKAEFVPIEDIATGEYSLGFGHALWFHNASLDEIDDELLKYSKHFEKLNALSQQRQRKIIIEANVARREYNKNIDKMELSLLADNQELTLFKEDWDDAPSGFQADGGDYERRRLNRLNSLLNDIEASFEASKKDKPSKKKRLINPNQIDIGFEITGRMKSDLIEMGPEEFARYPRNDAKQNFIDDILSLRRSEMDKYSIAEKMTNILALRAHLLANPGDGRKLVAPGFGKFSPTPELVHQLIQSAQKKQKISNDILQLNDKYTKIKIEDIKDIMNLASEGFTPREISNFLDISQSKVVNNLRRLGMQEKIDGNSETTIDDLIYRYENSPIQKGLYIESTHKRITLAELAEKYDMSESDILEQTNSYRNNVEKSEPEHHSMYRRALAKHMQIFSQDVSPNNAQSKNQLSGNEERVLRMRLDGLSIKDIVDVVKPTKLKSKTSTSAQFIRGVEQTALAKLRNLSDDDFLGIQKELQVIRYRLSSVNDSFLKKNQRTSFKDKKIAKYVMSSRELRDFENSKKEQYLLNAHMGANLLDIAQRYNIDVKEVESNIEQYADALQDTDDFRVKALRRTLAINGYEYLKPEEIDFVNMRADGASLKDLAKLHFSTENEMRAIQISAMTKFNNFNGLSGAMRSFEGINEVNLYNILNIDENATQDEIDSVFKAETSEIIGQALNGKADAKARLLEISKAYKILSVPQLNRDYRDGNLNLGNENLENASPTNRFTESGTGKRRPNWVADAILNEYNPNSNKYKMPYDLGSDYITDDIDDGILGFDDNDSDKLLATSMYYRKPQPGTPEWLTKKREAALARQSGDPRIIYDNDGFVIGSRMDSIPRFDNPNSPDYIGDKFGGPKKGSGPINYLYTGLTGSMKSLVPEGSWSIGDSLKKNSNLDKNTTNTYWAKKGFESGDLRPHSQFAQDLASDYLGWLNLPKEGEDTEYYKANLNYFGNEFAAMGNLRTASLMEFSPIELLDAIDELYENMPLLARQKATAVYGESYYGGEYQRYKSSPFRPFLRTSSSVPLLKDIASGKIKEFVYYDRTLHPGKIINRDGETFLTRQYSTFDSDTNLIHSEKTEEIKVRKNFDTELPPIQLNMDEDPKKALTYLKAVLIGHAISGPWLESNNSSIETQLLQQSVRRVFNLKDSIDPTELPGAKGSYRLGQSDNPDLRDGETLLSSLKKEYSLPPVLKKFLDDWVGSTYDQTQQYLDDLGGDEFFHLFRGASLPEMIDGRNTERPENKDKEYRKWLYSGTQEYDNPEQSKEALDFQQAPLSSWTISPAWARVFSYGQFGPSESKIGSTIESRIAQLRGASVIDAPIPKRLILSLPHSGLGTMQSGEIIVIGETLDEVRIRHSDSLPKPLWLVADDWDSDTKPDEQEALGGLAWAYKGQQYFVGDLRGSRLVFDETAEQFLAERGISGKMKSGGRIQAPFQNSENWGDESSIAGRMAGVFDGLNAKQKEDKKQKLIASFAKDNDMLPNYRRGKRVPIPIFPEDRLDTINRAEIKQLPKIERVKKMLDFVREELANNQPIYSYSYLADAFSLTTAGVGAIVAGEIPSYPTRKKEAWKKWKNALSAYVLDNKNKTLLDLADEIDGANNGRLVDQAPLLGLLRKELFGPILPFRKRLKPRKIVRLINGKEFTQKEYQKLQQKLLKMWSEGFAPRDIDKKLDVPENWAKNQIIALGKQKKLPKPPSPELSIIQYAADGFTATDILERFGKRKNWSNWDSEKIVKFVQKDGRFPNFKRGFRIVENALANNATVQRPSQLARKKNKKMNSRALAERNRIDLERAKKSRKRMKIEEPTRYQEQMAKRRAAALVSKKNPEQLAKLRKYQKEWREQNRRKKKSNKTNSLLTGRMAMPRKNWSGRDLYEDINASKEDSRETLREKFRAFSKKYHPDNNKGNKTSAERFRRGADAWGILSNPQLKKDYDDNFYPDVERRKNQNNQTSSTQRPTPSNSNVQSNQTSRSGTEAEAERLRREAARGPKPQGPPRANRRAGVKLPKIDDEFQKRINIRLPKVAHDPNIWDTMSLHKPVGEKSGVDVPTTFGGGTINVSDDRFFDVYLKVAVAMSDAAKTPRSAGSKKRFVIVGGAPGSGKSTLRKKGDYGIPKSNNSVHVDADEIKTIIPEAAAAHAAGDTEWASIAHEESRVISELAQLVAIQRGLDVVYDSTGQFNRGFDTLKRARQNGYDIVAHYLVAPVETLRERLQMRQLTDPRVLPPHIVPATIDRNFSTISIIAKSADEFSLWDSTITPIKLLAEKTNGGSLKIKDSEAFIHADLETVVPNHPLFEKPNSIITMKKSDFVARDRMNIQIFDMFENGQSVSEIATAMKLSPRKVFDILTRPKQIQKEPKNNLGEDFENEREYDVYGFDDEAPLA